MLLQLYAIECGLKLILLQRRQQHSTAELADDDRTHDLDTLLKRLNASLKDRIGNYKAQDPRGQALCHQEGSMNSFDMAGQSPKVIK